LESTLAANQAFHFKIYEAAGYPQLLDIISNLWLQPGSILAIPPCDENLFHKIFDIGYRVHNEVIEAIARRDRASTRRAIALDIRATFLNTPILQNGKVDEINTFLTRLKQLQPSGS